MTTQAPINYRGFSIEDERSIGGGFAVYRAPLGYFCTRKTVEEAKQYIDRKAD